MAKWKAATAELVWHGECPSDVVERVRADMAEELADRPHDLVFHHVFLGDNMHSGPIVTVWGEPGDKRLHCEYSAKVEWVTAEDVD